jgi:hypothetical protein
MEIYGVCAECRSGRAPRSLSKTQSRVYQT